MLYDTDYYLWIEQQAQALRDRNLEALDWENLVEEFEDLGKSELKTCQSFIILIILHRLYLDYWEAERDRNQFHWEGEITNFRIQLLNKLTTSIENKIRDDLDTLYSRARGEFEKKTKLNAPQECPYSLEELLKGDFRD